jgi:hypothetical protein
VKYHNEHQRVLELHQQVKELQRDYDNQKQLLLDCQCKFLTYGIHWTGHHFINC